MSFYLTPVPHFVKEGLLKNKAFAGYSKFCFIHLDLKRANTSTYHHELVHVKQWWLVTIISFFLFWFLLSFIPNLSYDWLYSLVLSISPFALLYKFSERFRFEMECMAYAKTLECRIKSDGFDKASRYIDDITPVIRSVYDFKKYTNSEIKDRIFYWYRG